MNLQLDMWLFWGIFFKIITPFLILALLVELIYSIPYWIREWRYRKAGLHEIDAMTGRDFELRLRRLFKNLGYKVELKPGYKDHGADLILTTPRGVRIAVQAKKLASREGRVGAKVIGEVLRGKQYYGCHYALIVTNQYFTEQAREEAKRLGVILWDRDSLSRQIDRENLMLGT